MFNKKLLCPLTLAIATALAPAASHAAPTPHEDASGSHWYLGVAVGAGKSQSTATQYDFYGTYITSSSTDGAALRIFGGWRYLSSRGDGIGIGITDTGISLGNSSAAGILGLDLNSKVHLVGPWFLTARVGGYSGRNFTVYDDNTYSYSDSQTGLFYGVGTGIDINDSNSLTLSWDSYQVKDYTDDSYYPSAHFSNVSLEVALLSYTYTF